jgi:hypothetical protein
MKVFLALDRCDHLLARTMLQLNSLIVGLYRVSFLTLDLCNHLLAWTSLQSIHWSLGSIMRFDQAILTSIDIFDRRFKRTFSLSTDLIVHVTIVAIKLACKQILQLVCIYRRIWMEHSKASFMIKLTCHEHHRTWTDHLRAALQANWSFASTVAIESINHLRDLRCDWSSQLCNHHCNRSLRSFMQHHCKRTLVSHQDDNHYSWAEWCFLMSLHDGHLNRISMIGRLISSSTLVQLTFQLLKCWSTEAKDGGQKMKKTAF